MPPIDYNELSGWGLAIILVILLMGGWILPRWTLNKILAEKEKTIKYLIASNDLLSTSVEELLTLTRNTNAVVTSLQELVRK